MTPEWPIMRFFATLFPSASGGDRQPGRGVLAIGLECDDPVPVQIDHRDACTCQLGVLADSRRMPAPMLADDPTRKANIEAFTVVHDRSGARHGAIVARGADGRRRLARVPEHDDGSLDELESPARSAVGRIGSITAEAEENSLRWRFDHE